MVFRWDPRKAASNRKKHGVGFNEAATVLDDTLSTTFPDDEHSGFESRFLTIGISNRGRPLVADTEERDSVRIISARRATSHERRFYEEG